ncbi:MAG: hypothetical protein E7080_06015 [Bacteroidales bacterium]|nr:hypothetical protein [Bacteroidales bacterium]
MRKTFIFLFAILPVLVMAQMTPEAVIANAPELPTAEEWGARGEHSDAFKAKMNELNDKLSKVISTPAKNITAQDFEQLQAQQRKRYEEHPKRMEQAAKGLEVMGMMMQKLGLTEADMKKLSKMSDKEAEAFMMKRMQEKGVNPNDLAAMAGDMGIEPADADMPQIDGNAIKASQEADMAYMEQSRLYDKKAREWEADAKRRIKAEDEKYMRSLPETRYGLDDVVQGAITREQYDAQQRHLQALMNDCRTAQYRIWTEVIQNCQGELKILMQFAVAADKAKEKMPSMTGNAAFDQLQQSSGYAVAVAGLYLDITESEPKF